MQVTIEKNSPSDVDLRHWRRKDHCTSMFIKELQKLDYPAVDELITKFQISIQDNTYAIEYPSDSEQIEK